MAGEWRERPLAELTDNFDGIRVPVKEADRRPGPFPYYGASGVVDHVDDYLFDGEYLLIAEDGENVRAQLRVLVKRILRKYGYPPDQQEKATQTVLEQAEVLSEIWAGASQTGR